jgi:uncharacterized membrane protein
VTLLVRTPRSPVSHPDQLLDPGVIPSDSADLPERIGWSLVALLVCYTGLQVWEGSLDLPGANVAAVVLIGVGLVAIWSMWGRREAPGRRTQLALLVVLAAGLAYQSAMSWVFDPSYQTDSVAFSQYAASLALHGHNPYLHSMQPAYSLFNVPTIFHTFQLDGGSVTSVSYPAGMFLVNVPLLALGVHTQAANIVDLAFWIVGIFVLWRCLPARARWVAGVLGATSVYVNFVIGGLTDAVFIPFVILAVYRWDRFSDDWGTRRWARWVGPISLGIACSLKQTPWFLIPFLVIGTALEARAGSRAWARITAAYVATVAAVFAAVNAPYIIWSPAAWAKATLVPFLSPTVPDGQGLVNLTLFERLGGGDLFLFTALGVLAVVLSWLWFVVDYPRLKTAWVPLVALSFFLPTRSFASYLFMLVPAALVAATTVRPSVAVPLPRISSYRRPIGIVGATGLVGIAVAACTHTAPLSMRIVGTRSTGQLQTLDEITVQVTNRTGSTLRPHFSVDSSDHVSSFWYSLGPNGQPESAVIAPHSTSNVVLHVPDLGSMPGVGAPMKVEAYTTGPDTVSSSPDFAVSNLHARIVPAAVDAPVPVGTPVRLTVQLENRYGAPVHRYGVPVTLGQIIYAQDGLLAGDASINGRSEGESPVKVVTNALGQAVFTISGVQAQSTPVYYEAWLGVGRAVPYRYSNQLVVQFVKAPRAESQSR